jgi:small-conductance mechanosensitive channel
MDLNLLFWIRDPENGQGQVKSDVNLAVLAVLDAEGIEIPFPQRVMHTPVVPAKEAG